MSTFSNIFSSETTGPIKVKFHVKPQWDGGTKVCSTGTGHITKMAAMPIYGKNLNLLLGNQKADDLETWYAALVGWLCWGLTSQSTIFQSYWDGAIASWVINQYFRGVKCLAQGHNTAAVGLEPRTSRSGVRHSTTDGMQHWVLRYYQVCSNDDPGLIWHWPILRHGQIWSLMLLYGKKVKQWIFSSPEPLGSLVSL